MKLYHALLSCFLRSGTETRLFEAKMLPILGIWLHNKKKKYLFSSDIWYFVCQNNIIFTCLRRSGRVSWYPRGQNRNPSFTSNRWNEHFVSWVNTYHFAGSLAPLTSVSDPDPPRSPAFGRIRIHFNPRSGSGSTLISFLGSGSGST